MSGAIKGYQSKQLPGNFEYATVENLNGNQFGLTTSSTVFYEDTGSDLTEASSVTDQIVATAHTARAGDVIRVTSGVNAGYSRRAVNVDANDIFFLDPFPLDFGVGDSFDILRPTVPTVDQLGGAMIAGAYPEDSAAVDGDTGLFVLAVRNDTNAVLTNTDGDYSGIAVDSAGRVKILESAIVADGGALPALVKVIGGYDGANVQVIHTDVAGDVQVDLASSIPAGANNIGDVDVLTEPATVANGGALPAVVKVMAGYDGANVQVVHTDAAGDVQVDLASAIPAGTNNIGDVDVLTEPATAADGGALPATTKVISGYDGANVQAIHTDASGDLQIDVLTLPGALTGYAEDTAHTTGDIGLLSLAVRNDAGTALAGNGDYIPISTDASGNIRAVLLNTGKSVVTTVRNDYSSVNVTSGAWVQLVASLSAAVTEIEIFDSSGQTLELGIGAAAAETRLIIVFPGGNGRVPVSVASATRISIRAISATADSGEIDINFYGV